MNKKMKTKKEIERQLKLASIELTRIAQEVGLGHCFWREQKRYVEALQWVLRGYFSTSMFEPCKPS